MRELFRHELDYDRTIDYVVKKLKNVTTLSSELLKITDFRLGRFVLPEGSDIQRIYEFEAGVVLPQNPDIEYEVNGRKATYCVIPTIHDELSDIILKKLEKNIHLSFFLTMFLLKRLIQI